MTSKNINIESAQNLAKAASDLMHERDHCAHALGITPISVAPGEATINMLVRKDMVNGHDICHGGMIFTLADTAFAHACNSHNNNTVASGCSIDFVHPAKANDTLTATAKERSLSGRTGVYDVTVINQEHQVIAHFRGRSYRISGHLVPENNE